MTTTHTQRHTHTRQSVLQSSLLSAASVASAPRHLNRTEGPTSFPPAMLVQTLLGRGLLSDAQTLQPLSPERTRPTEKSHPYHTFSSFIMPSCLQNTTTLASYAQNPICAPPFIPAPKLPKGKGRALPCTPSS